MAGKRRLKLLTYRFSIVTTPDSMWTSGNRIDYLPYEIEILTQFGRLLTKLQGTLSEEIKNVDQHLIVGLPTGYHAGHCSMQPS